MDLYVARLLPPAPFGIAPVGDQSQDITPWGGGIEPKMVVNFPVLNPPQSDDWSLDSGDAGSLEMNVAVVQADWPVYPDLGMIFRYRRQGTTNWISGSAAVGDDSGIIAGVAAGTYEVEAAWCVVANSAQLSDWTATKSQVVS